MYLCHTFRLLPVTIFLGWGILDSVADLPVLGDLDFNCTSVPLNVTFGQPIGAIHCGTKLSGCWTSPVQKQPVVQLPSAATNAQYLVMMVDPDAPTPQDPSHSPIRHWLVGNVPGSVLHSGGNISSATVLEPFHGPHPPQGSDYHRYGQFVFQQPQLDIKFAAPGSRTNWNYAAYLATYNIQPEHKLSSNYLLCEY